jgi:3-hydroxymyristoyl/3-hydroxydecanoyl-(acyl carrier protein) dehydratase
MTDSAPVPLQAVDEVVAECGALGWLIRARKVIVDHDPYLAGHFPGATVYPGVFVIESVRQAVAEGLGAACDLVSVCSARFLMPLVTGDVMVLEATASPHADGTFAVTARATVEQGNIPAAKVELLLRASGAVDAAA